MNTIETWTFLKRTAGEQRPGPVLLEVRYAWDKAMQNQKYYGPFKNADVLHQFVRDYGVKFARDVQSIHVIRISGTGYDLADALGLRRKNTHSATEIANKQREKNR